MKKILLSLAATAALAAAAAPAAAQTWGGYDHRDDYRPAYGQRTMSYVDALAWRIDNAVRERRISWSEARDLKAELRQAQPLAWRVQTGQANGWERQRFDRIVSRIERATSGYARYDRPNPDRDYAYGGAWRR